MYTFALTVYVVVFWPPVQGSLCWSNWRHPGFPIRHICCIDYTVALIIMQLMCYIKDIVLDIGLTVPFV